MKTNFALLWLFQLVSVSVLCQQNEIVQEQELLPVQVAGKWGYRTRQGENVIEPQYQYARRFKGNYAVVVNHDLLGAIDKSNQLVIPFKYEFIDPLNNNHFLFGYRDTYFGEYKMGVITNRKQVLIDPIFRSVSLIRKHYVVTTTTDSVIKTGELRGSRAVKSTYGLYNEAGKEVIPCRYNYLSWLDDSLLVLTLNDKEAMCSVTGKLLTGFDYTVISQFHEGLAGVVQNSLHGYIDRKGKIVIAPQFKLSEPFQKGVSMVMFEDKWGAIDKSGQFVIKPNYTFDEVKATIKAMPAK